MVPGYRLPGELPGAAHVEDVAPGHPEALRDGRSVHLLVRLREPAQRGDESSDVRGRRRHNARGLPRLRLWPFLL